MPVSDGYRIAVIPPGPMGDYFLNNYVDFAAPRSGVYEQRPWSLPMRS
jgi:hypothetical protein